MADFYPVRNMPARTSGAKFHRVSDQLCVMRPARSFRTRHSGIFGNVLPPRALKEPFKLSAVEPYAAAAGAYVDENTVRQNFCERGSAYWTVDGCHCASARGIRRWP